MVNVLSIGPRSTFTTAAITVSPATVWAASSASVARPNHRHPAASSARAKIATPIRFLLIFFSDRVQKFREFGRRPQPVGRDFSREEPRAAAGRLRIARNFFFLLFGETTGQPGAAGTTD